ncbi:hypothetical protein DFJ77DRAFT_49254 [Powellomyces hirtus]|nr:hypothetical protein DFJ77DRAFT_49254 [Powellomyces hirtus]
MPLILGEVPTPPYSDGTPNFYPTVYKTARAPAGGYAECQQARVQKYLDMLAPGLKDTYAAHPEKIPGIDKAALAHAGGKVVFKSNAVLKRLPEHYKMFESRKVEASADSAAGTPTTGSPAQGQPPSRLGNGSDTTTPKREFDVKKEGDASGKRASALKTSKFRSDAYIFGHPRLVDTSSIDVTIGLRTMFFLNECILSFNLVAPNFDQRLSLRPICHGW